MKTFNLPDLGEGLAEAEIVRWHVKAGDRINADDPMLAVETAKAIVEVPAPFSGIIEAIHGNPGDTVATGALLVEFEEATPAAGTSARASTASSVERHPAPDAGTVVGTMPTADENFVYGADNAPVSGNALPPDRIRAIPAARALAKRLGLDLTQIQGTGRGQLITVDDVLRVIPPGAHAAATGPATRHAPMGDTPHPTAASDPTPHRNIADEQAAQLPGAPPQHPGERLKGPRRAMAQSMAASRDHVMGCTVFDDADLHDWQPEQDVTSRILRAIAEGCSTEPGLNAWFDGETLTRQLLSHIDVAIAVDTPEGLIVPVIRNIRGRPVAELRRDVDRLKRDTHARSVRPADLRNFTFMLSNFGMIAGRYATPVVVPPAVAILGCGRLSHDVIATQNGIEAHLRMPLSLTFDHRCVTGGEAARFLAAVIRDLHKGN
ncbi:MAG: 2-oxo acid dehydrogenase subunit E2 [Proteobacteria bacterium]|nr:2-oxo acid dehydrogenase subunit E2 [Pseudomonadota bacterium]